MAVSAKGVNPAIFSTYVSRFANWVGNRERDVRKSIYTVLGLADMEAMTVLAGGDQKLSEEEAAELRAKFREAQPVADRMRKLSDRIFIVEEYALDVAGFVRFLHEERHAIRAHLGMVIRNEAHGDPSGGGIFGEEHVPLAHHAEEDDPHGHDTHWECPSPTSMGPRGIFKK